MVPDGQKVQTDWTKERASIIGDKLKLWLNISLKFVSVFFLL